MRLVFRTSEQIGHSSATYLLWETWAHGLVESSILYLHGREVPWVFCLPSSVGCSLGCRICAMPSTSSPEPLEKDDLIAVLRYSIRYSRTPQFQVSFMGQGEPLLNVQNIFDFCAQLYRDFPQVTIGISTVGISTGIRALASQDWVERVKLQISLHALPKEKRSAIIPAENRYPVSEAILEVQKLCYRLRRRCALNCTLLDGINDSPHDAIQIAEIAANGPFYVKVSEFNPHRKCPFVPASSAHMDTYCQSLEANKVEVHRFRSIGTNIGAGCGQTRLSSSVQNDCSIREVKEASIAR